MFLRIFLLLGIREGAKKISNYTAKGARILSPKKFDTADLKNMHYIDYY